MTVGPVGFSVSRDQVCSALCDLCRKKARLPMEDNKALGSRKQGHFGCSVCIGISLITATLLPLSVKLRISPANTMPNYLLQPAVRSQKHSGSEF